MAQSHDWLQARHEPGLVSVIIPTYNRATLLRETLKSILRQDYRPFEVIVVDDGSSDDTLPMLEQVSCPDGVQLRVIEGDHAGAAAARNRGAGESRGEFVMFFDSDDIMHEGALSALVGGIGNADLVHGRWRDWFSSESPPRYGAVWDRRPGPDLLVELLRNRWLLPSAVLHRRSSIRRTHGWDNDFTGQDDFEFMARVALEGATAAAVPRLVTDYRRHGAAQLSQGAPERISGEVEQVLRRVEAKLDKQGWTDERRRALAWRWYWEARKAWLNIPDRTRFHDLMGEARRVLPTFRPPRLWYRLIGRVAGYAAAERAASVGRLLFR